MAINQAVCASFKQELLAGDHDLDNDTINLALFTNAAIAVLDFGAVKTSTNGTFTIAFPTNDASSAILRLS
jgi:hypothetical protein